MTDFFKKYNLYDFGIEIPYINPNLETERYWLYARRKDNEYPNDSEFSGKWLIFVDYDNVNEVWKKIKKATEEGALGNVSKVSTSRKRKYHESNNQKVICVYTYNYKDESDILSIRKVLFDLGIIQEIPYKSNNQTNGLDSNTESIFLQ